jgi:hypothetical protein
MQYSAHSGGAECRLHNLHTIYSGETPAQSRYQLCLGFNCQYPGAKAAKNQRIVSDVRADVENESAGLYELAVEFAARSMVTQKTPISKALP